MNIYKNVLRVGLVLFAIASFEMQGAILQGLSANGKNKFITLLQNVDNGKAIASLLPGTAYGTDKDAAAQWYVIQTLLEDLGAPNKTKKDLAAKLIDPINVTPVVNIKVGGGGADEFPWDDKDTSLTASDKFMALFGLDKNGNALPKIAPTDKGNFAYGAQTLPKIAADRVKINKAFKGAAGQPVLVAVIDGWNPLNAPL